jgi:outer membrane lipoprotein-sorting protein
MRNFLVFCLLFTVQFSIAQTADEIVAKLKAKLVSVKDYEAIGKLKTDVAFLKIPISAVRIFYKYPDQFRIKKDGGISVLPKGGIKVNMSAMIADGNYTALLAGRIKWKEQDLAMLKLIPNDMNSDVVITTLYVDDKEMLIRKSITSTKENGTYEMEMDYGKYAKWGLPDKAIMIFNTKDYKLPKGITFEYDAGVGNKQKSPKPLSNKGRIEIIYQAYEVNKGLKPEVFTAKN